MATRKDRRLTLSKFAACPVGGCGSATKSKISTKMFG
jgi:hypothetical protein